MLDAFTASQIAAQPKATPVQLLTMVAAERMRREFITFAQRAWHIIEPKRCKWNWHMDAIAEHLAYVTQGEIRFLMVMIPPRMSKSLLCTVLWPAWHWLQKPQTQFICASYNEKLSLGHSALSRRIIESGWFQQFYGSDWYLLPDENRVDKFRNSMGGYRLTTSVDGRTTGEGGDIQLGDDFHDAKKVESDAVRQSALTWHDNAWRSRVNDPNRSQKVYIAQRTHDADVMGHVIQMEGHRWVQLCLPMEYDTKRKCITYLNKGAGNLLDKQIFEDPRKVDGELLNPKRFNKETAEIEKTSGMTPRAWNAQYQQQPEGAGGLILKRHWWRQWVYPEWHELGGKERPLPDFFEIIQVYDTAFEEKEEADFSAMTTWGMFSYREQERNPKSGSVRQGQQRVCAMLLDMMCDRLEYPELREKVIGYDKAYAPDWVLIEKKASGHSLIQELKRKRIPIKAVKLTDGGDLVARVHEASLMLYSGCIWYVPRQWSYRVIDSAAKFPAGDHDDIEATLAIAWQYMRRYYDLTLPDDEPPDEIAPFRWKRERRYA